MDAPRLVSVAAGRRLALDDVGDPDGRPVLYLHGNPDSRLARHPDDGIAAGAGVRLLAVDRPGFGASDPDPTGGLTALGRDLGRVLDELGIATVALLGWSSGGLAALAAAAELGDRVDAVVTLASLPPVEAYTDPVVVEALGPARRSFVELAAEVPPDELAAEVAPHLVPLGITDELALDHVREGAGPVGRAEMDAVPGAAEQLGRALVEAVRQGTVGVEHDLRLQLTPGLDLSRIAVPVRCLHGGRDDVAPPTVGAWLVARLPHGTLDVLDGAGHHMLFPHWGELMRSLSRRAAR